MNAAVGEGRPHLAVRSSRLSSRRDVGAAAADCSEALDSRSSSRRRTRLPGSFRQPGGPHTAEQYLFPSHLGDSTARWEGDTLVVDVISFNGEGWLAERPGQADQAAAPACG